MIYTKLRQKIKNVSQKVGNIISLSYYIRLHVLNRILTTVWSRTQ